jgi:hypothetical protein
MAIIMQAVAVVARLILLIIANLQRTIEQVMAVLVEEAVVVTALI